MKTQISKLKSSLIEAGETQMSLDYHQPSNTHIAYCMAIGRHGVKGFGHTADVASDKFLENLNIIVKNAPDDEVTYWKKRCDIELATKEQEKAIANLADEPLSGQIGMAVPEDILDWLDRSTSYSSTSRNNYVLKLLVEYEAKLDERIENESTWNIRQEIRTGAEKTGSGKWSQHVPKRLQAKLILLARRLDVSVSMLGRYMCKKGFQESMANQTVTMPSYQHQKR